MSEMKKIWKMPIDLESMQARNANTMMTHLGIEITEIGDNFLKAKMPVDERTRQPLGIMNGGASCVLAESLGSTAANYCVDQTKYYCVGLDINTNHIGSARDGYVYATAKPFHLGKTTQVWSIEIYDDKQKLVSVTRLTMAVLQRT